MKSIMVLLILCLGLTGCLESSNESVAETSSPAQQPKKPIDDAQKEFEGFDLKGEKRSCPPMEEGMMCTMQMTDADFFGQKCKQAGHEAFQCGCHDWLCSENLAATAEK